MAQSKNSRSIISKSNQPVGLHADIHMIIPCNFGRNAYIMDIEDGANVHIPTSSDRFIEILLKNKELGYDTRIVEELDNLHSKFPEHSWDEVGRRYSEAAAGAVEEPA